MNIVQFDFKEHIQFILDAFEESADINFPDFKRTQESRIMDYERFKDLNFNDNDIRLLSDNAENIGFIWISYKYNKIEKIKSCNLNYIYISQEYRGKGHGKYLMNIFEEEARLNNVHVLDLEVTASNESALKLYDKMGFVTKRYVMRKGLD